MKIYHYSDKDIKRKLRVRYFGENYFTQRDKSISGIKRLFFYTVKKPGEYLLNSKKYLYVSCVDKKQIYNLAIDRMRYLQTFDSISYVLAYLRKKYLGIQYTLSGYSVVCIFKDIEIHKQIKLRG